MQFTFPILAQVYWHASNLWPAAALAAALLLGAVLLLYPAQLQDVHWPWKGVLPGLRLLAVFALAISVLKPVAMRLATADERGAVVILVDRSRSMSIVDNTRTPAQLVALADALGRLPANVRTNAATELATDLERMRTSAAEVRGAQEDLDYARVSGRDVQFRQKVLNETAGRYAQMASALLEKAGVLSEADELVRQLAVLARPPDVASRDLWRNKVPGQIEKAAQAVVDYQESSDDRLYESNNDVQSACNAVASLSRFSLVEQALLRPGGIVASSRKNAAVSGFSFSGEIAPLELMQGDQVVASLNATPDGLQSDLTAGIARAVGGRPVLAVVLFSDGRQVGGDPTIVSGLTPNGVPIFTVSAAAMAAPLDLSFLSVDAPSSVFAGQSVMVKAQLRHDGFDGKTVELHCKIGDEGEQVRKIVLHDGKPAGAEFPARLLKPGVQRVRLWFPAVEGEASVDNNEAQRWIKVVPERMKVLLVAGSPTWDFQYVRNALARSPEVQLKDVVLDPNNAHLNISAAEILSQDVIVMFDVPAAALNERQWDATERMARVAGGSVILVAGDAHLPAEYSKYVSTATLIPFRTGFKSAWRVWPGEDPAFHFVPAADAENLDFLKLPTEAEAGEAEQPARRWEQLPASFRFLVVQSLREWKQQAHPLLVDEESRLPVLTEMRVGAGRSFFLGSNETWRWRYKVGDRDQEHFWRQLIQYASEDPYFAHEGPLSLDTDKVSASPGEAIHVRARMTEEVADPQTVYSLDVLLNGSAIAEQVLSPAGPAGGGRFTAALKLPAGDYEIRWNARGAGQKMHSVKMPLHVGATSEAELSDLSGDPRMLHKLAEASGGEFFTLDQIGRLPDRLTAAGDSRSRFAELSLWDSPYLFALVVGCLGAEWALRKRLGLA